jgi:hypothetical protein
LLIHALHQAIPGVLLWSLALGVLISYWESKDFMDLLDRIGDVRSDWGVGFTGLSVGFSGGLLPSLLMYCCQKRSDNSTEPIASSSKATAAAESPAEKVSKVHPASLILYNTLLFAGFGVWIDIFYQLQAVIFGEEADFGTVVVKMLFDQLVFTPFLHVPFIQLALMYPKYGFDCCAFARAATAKRMFTVHGLLGGWLFPALLPTWLIWAPTVLVVYSLPSSLQVIIFAIVETFWALIQMVLGDEHASEE